MLSYVPTSEAAGRTFEETVIIGAEGVESNFEVSFCSHDALVAWY